MIAGDGPRRQLLSGPNRELDDGCGTVDLLNLVLEVSGQKKREAEWRDILTGVAGNEAVGH